MRHAAFLPALTLVVSLAIATPSTADRVETQENIAYSLPDGWKVDSYSKASGSALLSYKDAKTVMLVTRYGLASQREVYENRETLPGGRVLNWRYETIPVFNSIFLEGRVTLADAHVEMAVSNKDQTTRPDQTIGLAAMRQIAQSAAVLGPRLCTGGCEPGKVVKIN